VKLIIRATALLFFSLFAAVNLAHAQGGSVYFGVGTAMDSSSNQSVDTFGTGNPFTTPKLTGSFGTIGAEAMFRSYLGFGGEASFRFRQGRYAGLNYRPTFYDFNAIFMPFPKSTRVVPEFQAGLGGAKLSFYYSQQFCSIFAGCQTSNGYLLSSNHFQLHAGAGVRFYITSHTFIRPQADLHYVTNFFQFGRNRVPEYSVAIGYTFGR
jgi:outer membrane protein with beta-barrel domain